MSQAQEVLGIAAQQALELVVLDLVLPDLSGFEVLREIRRVSEVPVIMLTGRQTDHVRGLDLGADDYIAQPVTSLTLLARMRDVFARGQKARWSRLHLAMSTLRDLGRDGGVQVPVQPP